MTNSSLLLSSSTYIPVLSLKVSSSSSLLHMFVTSLCSASEAYRYWGSWESFWGLLVLSSISPTLVTMCNVIYPNVKIQLIIFQRWGIREWCSWDEKLTKDTETVLDTYTSFFRCVYFLLFFFSVINVTQHYTVINESMKLEGSFS